MIAQSSHCSGHLLLYRHEVSHSRHGSHSTCLNKPCYTKTFWSEALSWVAHIATDLPREKLAAITEGKKGKLLLSDQKYYQALPSHKSPRWQIPFTTCLLPFPRFICSPFALFFNDNLVIHAKLALWHSTQITLHHHSARHMGTQNLTWIGKEHSWEYLSTQQLPGKKKRQLNSSHLPWGDIKRFTLSSTSRKSSLRRYLIPSRLHPICPVTWLVIWDCSSLVWRERITP